MEKTVFFAFRGDAMCFIHVLLNALDMADKGMEGKIVMEGESVKLIPPMAKPGHFLHPLFSKVRDRELLLGACRACSMKLGVAEAVKEEGIPLIGAMSGHPAISEYIEKGYRVLTF